MPTRYRSRRIPSTLCLAVSSTVFCPSGAVEVMRSDMVVVDGGWWTVDGEELLSTVHRPPTTVHQRLFLLGTFGRCQIGLRLLVELIVEGPEPLAVARIVEVFGALFGGLAEHALGVLAGQALVFF